MTSISYRQIIYNCNNTNKSVETRYSEQEANRAHFLILPFTSISVLNVSNSFSFHFYSLSQDSYLFYPYFLLSSEADMLFSSLFTLLLYPLRSAVMIVIWECHFYLGITDTCIVNKTIITASTVLLFIAMVITLVIGGKLK